MYNAILRTVGKKKKKNYYLHETNYVAWYILVIEKKIMLTLLRHKSCHVRQLFFLHYNRENDSLSLEIGTSAIAVFLNHFFHVKNSHEFSLSKVWLQMHALLTFSGRHVIIDHIIISQLEGPVQLEIRSKTKIKC